MNASDSNLPFNHASTFYFYGVDNYRFKLKHLKSKEVCVYEAVENESDGYRSYLETVKVAEKKGGIFFRAPIDEVRVEFVDDEDNYGFDGFRLVSVLDGHVWLEVGTFHHDEYYPSFTFTYHPRA